MMGVMARISLLVQMILLLSLPICSITMNLSFLARNLVNLSHLQASKGGDISHKWCGRVPPRLAAQLWTALVKVFKKLVPPQHSTCAIMALLVSSSKVSYQRY